MNRPAEPGQDGALPLPPEGALPTAGPDSPAPRTDQAGGAGNPPPSAPPQSPAAAAPPPPLAEPDRDGPAAAPLPPPPSAPRSNTALLVSVIVLLLVVIGGGVTLYLTGAFGGQSGSSASYSSGPGEGSGEVLPLAPATIAGGWSSTDCADPTIYRSDGTWGGASGTRLGTFTINGNQLTETMDAFDGETTYRIDRLTRDSYTQTSPRSGTTRAMRRCAGG